MTSLRRSSTTAAGRWLSAALALTAGLGMPGMLVGCASPGPPHPPSLQIPAPVKGLQALRRDGNVELRFTLPKSTTDNQPLKAAALSVILCRSVAEGQCKPLPGATTVAYQPDGPAAIADALPADLENGEPRLLAYRVRLLNPGHKDRLAEWSEPVYTAAGVTPAGVVGLKAEGSRLGIVVSWQATDENSSKVILRREGVVPKKKDVKLAGAAKPQDQGASGKGPRSAEQARSEVVLLDAGHGPIGHGSAIGATLDTNVLPEEPYTYAAERVRTVTLKGHSVQLHSGESPVIAFTLHDTYPPPPPTDLSVAGFSQGEGASATYAADLIWQPVDDANLAGYVVYRQASDLQGNAAGQSTRLTKEPVALPAFHDATVEAKQAYRYSVTSIDRKGNESAAATAMLAAQVQ